MKDVEEGKIISVKSLELQEEFARGRLDEFSYKTDFDSLDEPLYRCSNRFPQQAQT